MAHAPLNRLAARTLALLALLSVLALPGARPVSATPALAPAKAAAAQEIPPPDTLLSEQFSGFTTVNSTVFWYQHCSSEQPITPDTISRVPVQGGESHQLYNVVHDCSSSTFRSNIVADADYVYWANDSGLLRLSTNANVGDQPQVLSAAAAGSWLLAIDNNAIYTLNAIRTTSTYTATVQQVAKADGATTTLVARPDSGIRSSLQVSHAFSVPSGASDYLYWLEDSRFQEGILMRYNLNSGALDAIISGVGVFHAEGGVTSCENLHCTTTDRVYFNNDKGLSYYNNYDGTTTLVYNSYGAGFNALTTDRRHLFLVISETKTICRPRPMCEGVTFSWLIRAKREASGEDTTLYEVYSSSNLTIANGYLLWRSGGRLQRLPADVGLPHLYMPVIRR